MSKGQMPKAGPNSTTVSVTDFSGQVCWEGTFHEYLMEVDFDEALNVGLEMVGNRRGTH